MTGRAVRNLLVTGGTGFVGGALLHRLAMIPGLRVRAATRGRACHLPAAVEVVQVGDLSPDTDWRSAVFGADVVVHVAARVHVMDEVAADPLAEFRRVNVSGTLRLASEAADAGVRRLVFISSIKVNGERTSPGQPFRSEDVPSPMDPYAHSKLEAERGLADVARQTGLEVVIVRPPLVYGFGVKANFERLMKLVYRGVPLPLGSVRNSRSMIGLDNLVDLLVRCVDAPEAAGQTFLVSDGRDLSTPELIRLIAAAMGRSPRLLPVPVAVLRLAGALTGKGAEVERLCGSLQVDSSETRRVLGWEPPVSVEEAVRRTVSGYL
ncbi:MAG: NAD-dependent epimerase/dehydratase family protein [Aquisalimonadaceae bacterium]